MHACIFNSQVAAERTILANALAALAEKIHISAEIAAVAAENVAFAAGAIKDEGGCCWMNTFTNTLIMHSIMTRNVITHTN